MPDEGGGVQIRLSQDGGEDVVRAIQAVNGSIAELKRTADNTFSASLFTAGNQAIELFEKLAGAIRGPIEEGIAFNAQLEQAAIKIAGLISVYNTVAPGVDKYAVSVKVAAEAHELLIAAAARTGSSIEGMAEGFEKLYGVARMGGAKSIEQVVELETSVASFARVMGTSVENASSQVARAMQGMVNTRTEFGKFLTSLGIDRQTMLEWQAQGESVKNVTALLRDFNALAPVMRDTWVGMTTNMSNAWKQFVGDVTGPAFLAVKDAMRTFLGGALNMDTGKLSGPLSEYAKGLGESIGEIVRAFTPLVDSVVKFGLVTVKTFVEFVAILKPVAPVLKDIIDLVTLLVDKFGALGLGVGAAAGAFGMMSKAVSATGVLGFIGTFVNSLGGLVPAAGAAGKAGAEMATGLEHIAPAARQGFESIFKLETAANTAQVASLGLATRVTALAIPFGPLAVAIIAAAGALAIFYEWAQKLAAEQEAAKSITTLGEVTEKVLSKLDLSKIPKETAEAIEKTRAALAKAEADFEKMHQAAIAAAKGTSEAFNKMGGSAELERLKTQVEDLTGKLSQLVIPALRASHGPAVVPPESEEDKLRATKKIEAEAKLFAASEALAAAHARALESIASGGQLKEMQAYEEHRAKIAKLQEQDKLLSKDPEGGELHKKNLAEQDAADQLYHNKRMLREQEFAALVLKDSDAMVVAHERAVRAGMSGTGGEIQTIEDTKADAQMAAYRVMEKARIDYENNKKTGLKDLTVADKEYAEAVRVYNGAVADSTLEASNKETVARQKISDALRTNIGAYDVDILTSQGRDFEAALLRQNNKLLDDEIKFGVAWKDTVAKIQVPDLSGVYGSQMENPAMASLKKALADLATASAATAPVIIENIKAIFDAMEKGGALSPELAKVREELNKMGAASAGATAKLEQDNAAATAGMTGNWSAYWANQIIEINKGAETFNEGLKKMGDEQARWAVTAAQGWTAGFNQIMGSVKGFGADVATLMTSVWSSLTSSFETGFYDILTGKFDDLGNVLKSLWDSILKDFSKMLAQMLERWILTGDAMGSGEGGGGIMGTLKGLLGGSNAVTTPGGTSATSPYQTAGTASWAQDNTKQGWGRVGYNYGGSAPAAGEDLGAASSFGVYGAAAYGLYSGIAGSLKPHETSRPTYQGQDLGQTADFGGPGGTAALTAATQVLAATAAYVVLTGAAISATVPVIGWVVAAVLLLVAAVMAIFSGPQEGHVQVAVKDAFDKSNAQSVIGHFVEQIVDQTGNFVGSLALRAAGPDNVGKFVTAYNKAFKDALGTATFDIAAGSKDDLQKDVQNFFDNVLPKMALQTAFGQTKGMPLGDRDWQGGAAGLDWNTNNALMDKQGNFIKTQLYDPSAPIPMLLSGIGFTADAIGEIATKLSVSTDMKAFKQWLMDLVDVVVGLGELQKKFAQTTADWVAFIHKTEAEAGTAAQFKTQISNLAGEGVLLESTTGDDRVTTAKQLVTDSTTLLNNMGQALQTIVDMMDAIKTTSAATIQSYRDKLLTPLEREAESRAAYVTDVAKIADAANPKEVQAAWQQVMKDLSATLDAIVARISEIKSLQQSYADFRTQMATNAGPQFATDPDAWLRQNQSQIDTVTTTLKTATGDDAIKGARELLRLTQERYNNELAMLQRVNSAIQSITEQGKQTDQNLEMQAMGSVVGGKWVPDTHAQGEYLKGQYDDLMKQLGSAKTPEEVQRLYGKLEGIISQLAAQPQDPAHYLESRRILQGMNTEATNAATELLKKWGKTLDDDLSGTGDKLKAGETALADALDAAQKDFDYNLGLMSDAATQANAALQNFADGITTAMQEVAAQIAHWTFVMTNAAGAVDPNWDYTKGAPKAEAGASSPPEQDVWVDDPNDATQQVAIAGPDKGKKRKKTTAPEHAPATQPPGTAPPSPGTPTPHVPAAAGAVAAAAAVGTPTNPLYVTSQSLDEMKASMAKFAGGLDIDALRKHLSGNASNMEELKNAMATLAAKASGVAVIVNSGGTPEEIAQAAADAVYAQTIAAIKASNTELFRALRNNPTALGFTPTVR